jgi:hypothetical protein
MRKAIIPAFLLLLGSAVLGATVLREPIARAATPIASVFVTNDSAHAVPVRSAGRTITVFENALVSGGTTGLISGPFDTSDCRGLELFVQPGAGVSEFFEAVLYPVVGSRSFGNTFLAAGLKGATPIGGDEANNRFWGWTWERDGMPVTAPAVKVQITFGPLGPSEPQPFDGAWLYCAR